jgi:hypothetical protein
MEDLIRARNPRPKPEPEPPPKPAETEEPLPGTPTKPDPDEDKRRRRKKCKSKDDPPCDVPLPILWPRILPLPRDSRPLVRTPSGDWNLEPEATSTPQRNLQQEINAALERFRGGDRGAEVPRPCSDTDTDPNAPHDAHHIHPLFLGGAEDEINLCALAADMHQLGHPLLYNQHLMLAHPTWIACRECRGNLRNQPGEQHYYIEGEK